MKPEPSGARFESMLVPGSGPTLEVREPPACFRDLALDQIVASITRGFEEYDLAPFFHAPPGDEDTVAYRQEVMRDLDQQPIRQAIARFGERMASMRRRRAGSEKLRYPRATQRWLLSAMESYCDAVRGLCHDLGAATLRSRSLRALHAWLADRVAGAAFSTFAADVARVKAALSAVRYSVVIKGGTVTVQPYTGEADDATAIEKTFERFRRGAAKDYRVRLPLRGGMNHVEAQILERAVLHYPEPFGALDELCAAHADFADEVVVRLDREAHFYLAFLAWADTLRHAGLPLCVPEVLRASKSLHVRDGYDAALATGLVAERATVVTNDVSMGDAERVLVVTGPNQGGKTTYARMIGQLCYLGSIGCMVPALEARFQLCDRVFAHFEREERVQTLRGKLEDDLVRLHGILEVATRDSLIVLNELFSSTTSADALSLGRQVKARLVARDVLCVWVTFIDEIAAFDERTVSVVGGVDPADPTRRTFRFERRPPEGLAYALAVAAKHGVTYARVKERVGP